MAYFALVPGEFTSLARSGSDAARAAWFRLGDQDLGLHLERTRRHRLGQPHVANQALRLES